jgi:hypothetical protein
MQCELTKQSLVCLLMKTFGFNVPSHWNADSDMLSTPAAMPMS